MLLSQLFNLLLMNVFHQYTLVLEDIALCLHVQIVVQVSVDLLVLSVFLQEATQDTHPSDPKHFDWHTGVGGTLSLTSASVTTLATSLNVAADTGARVDSDGLADDQTIFDQLSHVLTRVGVGNLVAFIRIKPDLVPSALEHGRSQTLLESQ